MDAVAAMLDNVTIKLDNVTTDLGSRLDNVTTDLGSRLANVTTDLGSRLGRIEKNMVWVFDQAMDPWKQQTSSTSKSERQDFRESMIAYYHEPGAGTLKCMVTGELLEGQAICAAHIWPARARDTRCEHFGLSIDDFDSARNGLFLEKSIETLFDKQRVSFSYNVIKDEFNFQVMDPSLLNGGTVLNMSYKDLDGKRLILKEGCMPFRRLLVWHYAASITLTHTACA